MKTIMRTKKDSEEPASTITIQVEGSCIYLQLKFSRQSLRRERWCKLLSPSQSASRPLLREWELLHVQLWISHLGPSVHLEQYSRLSQSCSRPSMFTILQITTSRMFQYYIMTNEDRNYTEADYHRVHIHSGMIANFVNTGNPSWKGQAWTPWSKSDRNYFVIGKFPFLNWKQFGAHCPPALQLRRTVSSSQALKTGFL